VGTGALQLRRKPFVVQHSKTALGTYLTITVHHHDAKEAELSIKQAFAAVDHVDRLMSIHRSSSEVSHVNAMAGKDLVSVDPKIINVLGEAKRFHDLTAGCYDITCLPLMKLYGFYQTNTDRYPSDREIRQTLERVGQEHIVIDAVNAKVGLTKSGSAIDLGSIGKGFAADEAGRVLREFGIEHALIDVGGNLLAIGAPHEDVEPAKGWRVAIKNPAGDKEHAFFETLELRDQAIATSGNYEQQRILGHHVIGHIIDANSGIPTSQGISSTVVAATAMQADALSTSAFLLGTSAKTSLGQVATHISFHG
ncbi:MAG: FAD:protein FMN transferase, partial [Deltaproteobacteria bacterium]|nr:FAD:protein FMN transferase [Deltaproteobacteria bacterium]